MEESLASLCHRGAKIVRLDAFGYATKKPGTRCFFEVGQIWSSQITSSHVWCLIWHAFGCATNRPGTRCLFEVRDD